MLFGVVTGHYAFRGRGIAAGHGKTAGRGTKGQKARTGYSKKPGFEGGQNPLMQRMPKLRGFTSHATAPEVVYTAQINELKTAIIDNQELAKNGLVSSPYKSAKLIVKGDISRKLTINIQSASAAAIKLVEINGGKVNIIGRVGQSKAKAKTEEAVKSTSVKSTAN